ncbi:hypothetical protein Anapl_04190 [Anas platyrhynchos]|uniref:Secreted protein n=1 Tax=Anas platyrhynchos TaxID=8839 RepID=R0LF78_ANAPL|nr:hypothetical protein Anapl_04190 [Anas platyrhynchos]
MVSTAFRGTPATLAWCVFATGILLLESECSQQKASDPAVRVVSGVTGCDELRIANPAYVTWKSTSTNDKQKYKYKCIRDNSDLGLEKCDICANKQTRGIVHLQS